MKLKVETAGRPNRNFVIAYRKKSGIYVNHRTEEPIMSLFFNYGTHVVGVWQRKGSNWRDNF